jgi:hypothetical protein
VRRTLIAIVLPAVAAAAVLLTGQACSSFGATPEGAVDAAASDGATPGDGGTALDAAALDAASCDASATILDFDSDPLLTQGFTADVATGGRLTRSPGGGVGGSGALQSDLAVPAGADGPWAQIFKHFDVAPAEVELSYDFTAPTASKLYVSAGCQLSFHATATDQIRTSVSVATFDMGGPTLQVESRGPDAGPLAQASAGAVTGEFHHVTMRVVIDPTGTSAQVHAVLDGVPKDLAFPLIVVPSTVTLVCGAYADSTATNVTVLVDNVRFAICRTRP